MIIYNKTWLANKALQEQIENDVDKRLISEAEFKAIAEKYPIGFYTPSLLVRVGLFILTCLIVTFGDGLLSLIFAGFGSAGYVYWSLFLGILSYLSLELIINIKFHYRSGVDDALLFISACQFITGTALALTDVNGPNFFAVSGVVFLLLLFLSLRFSDMLASAGCCLAFFAFIYLGWIKTGAIGLATMPFVIILASAFLYLVVYRYKSKKELINYYNCLVISQVICLAILYAAGNYYIVNNLKDELTGIASNSIPFGAFFWPWTILLPFVYVGFGIKKKDAILLRTGLILIAAAVATFRHYYFILPVDVMLALSGALILGVVYTLIKYLKTRKYDFTYTEPAKADIIDRIKVESLMVAATFSHTPAAQTDKGVKFGGGDFGGGGSSGDF